MSLASTSLILAFNLLEISLFCSVGCLLCGECVVLNKRNILAWESSITPPLVTWRTNDQMYRKLFVERICTNILLWPLNVRSLVRFFVVQRWAGICSIHNKCIKWQRLRQCSTWKNVTRKFARGRFVFPRKPEDFWLTTFIFILTCHTVWRFLCFQWQFVFHQPSTDKESVRGSDPRHVRRAENEQKHVQWSQKYHQSCWQYCNLEP